MTHKMPERVKPGVLGEPHRLAFVIVNNLAVVILAYTPAEICVGIRPR